MNRILVLVLLVLVVVGSRPTYSQRPVELPSLAVDIVDSIQAAKAEWKYERVSPIKVTGANEYQETSDDVILQQWSFENQSVRISVVSHKSVSDAIDAMQNLARRGPRRATEDLGEEAVTWGRGTVSFRKRDLTISVNAVIIDQTSDATEAGKHESDERKLSQEFARLVAAAIKNK